MRVYLTRRTRTANQKSFGRKFVSITSFIPSKLRAKISTSMKKRHNDE